MLRYLRAFFIALRMTLRGETPPPPRHAALRDWITATQRQAATTLSAADAAGLDETVRKEIKLVVEGREISMQTILGTVLYHAKQEYPYLLQHETEHTITAIYATNLNDQHLVNRLLERVEPPIKAAVEQLQHQLSTIPSSNATS